MPNLYHKISRSAAFKESAQKQAAHPELISRLLEQGEKDVDLVLKEMSTPTNGFSGKQAETLLKKHGRNLIVHEKIDIWPVRLLKTFLNPLVILLSALALISFLTGDPVGAMIIVIMVIISVSLRFIQETQAFNSAESLRSLIKTTCSVLRDGKIHEIHLDKVVPGDILHLSAGDIVPADARIITSKDLFISQSVLTGESFPIEKHAVLTTTNKKKTQNPLALETLCFMGTNVQSGTAQVVILGTGANTYLGSLAQTIVGESVETSFDKGISRFTWLIMAFMGVMVPLVFLANGLTKHNWWEAFLFAISVAVGLTPEMLPALVTVNLSKGAIMMGKKKVIVKHLSSIQNFGAMDVLCTDKTGTLTQNKVVLVKNIDIEGKTDPFVLENAFLNSSFQTGFKNLLDEAVLKHGVNKSLEAFVKKYKKIDELPFDFVRRRMSIVVKDYKGKHILICKGAAEEVLEKCTHYQLNGKTHSLKVDHVPKKIKDLKNSLGQDGFRDVAVAYREIEKSQKSYSKEDEKNMTFLGFIAFLDPPKESAALAIKDLQKYGVMIKILTGDNDLVSKKVCKEVGLDTSGILLGEEVAVMKDKELKKAVEKTTIFAKLTPKDKRRIIEVLRSNNHVVGFMGDGVNDASAMRAADVGISVDSGVDIAKESADIILLEKNLLVLKEGVIEGRKVFGNIIKYIKMGASSNFGNMLSVLGTSLFLPFLPMLPLQILLNNLLYDFSQTTIPTDNVDVEYLEKPREWKINNVRRFMLIFGPISSLFDYATFGVLLLVFNAWSFPALFQTGWFVESLLSQTLIIHIIRSYKFPFIQTLASKPLLFTSLSVALLGVLLVLSPAAHIFGFASLPELFWVCLFIILSAYMILTQLVKNLYVKKYGFD